MLESESVHTKKVGYDSKKKIMTIFLTSDIFRRREQKRGCQRKPKQTRILNFI